MAATGTPTPNIGLRRPQGTDPASVDDINYNSNLIDTKLGAVGNTSVQAQINSLNSNFNQRGQNTLLAICNAVDDFTLADSIQNYKFIFVRLGYYNSGYANYGNALIPVSTIDISSDKTYALRVTGADAQSNLYVDLLFTSNTTVKVITKQNVNVARVFGIK